MLRTIFDRVCSRHFLALEGVPQRPLSNREDGKDHLATGCTCTLTAVGHMVRESDVSMLQVSA